MRLNKKFPIIGSIFLMLSLIASLFVRIKYGFEPKRILDINIESFIYISFIIFFVVFWYYVLIKESSPSEKKVYLGWLICFLVQQIIFIFPGISTTGNVVSMIVIGFSIYYALQVLKEPSSQ